jgi:hypothetical protein
MVRVAYVFIHIVSIIAGVFFTHRRPLSRAEFRENEYHDLSHHTSTYFLLATLVE